MLFHAKSINAPYKVVIRTADTDVLVITLCNLPKLYQGLKVWLEVDLTSNNTLPYINVNEIYQSLGYRLCRALPGYHAFTRCDFTASFSRKGKVNPLKKLRKNAMTIKVFSELGEKETVDKKQIRDIEKFVCEMYGRKQIDSVNDARLEIFLKKYKPNTKGAVISCVKKMESSSLLPCSRVIKEKIKRTTYICSIWNNTTIANPPDFKTKNCG